MAGARFYFDWANYFTMLKLLRADPNPARRRRLLAAFLLGVPLLAAVHTVCFALDPLLFGSLRRTEVREPVFAVGHARSGTTYLHRLMAKDDQFSVVLLYEMLFPSLLEKRLLRLVFRLDERVFGSRLRRRIDEAEQRAFAETNDMHRTGFFAGAPRNVPRGSLVSDSDRAGRDRIEAIQVQRVYKRIGTYIVAPYVMFRKGLFRSPDHEALHAR